MPSKESQGKKEVRRPSRARTAMLGATVFAAGYFSNSAQDAVFDYDKSDEPAAGKTATALPVEQPKIRDRNPVTHPPKEQQALTNQPGSVPETGMLGKPAPTPPTPSDVAPPMPIPPSDMVRPMPTPPTDYKN